MCVGDGISLDSTNQTSETWMMNSPRALAEKIRKELRTQPELKDQLSRSLDRLILFLKLSEHESRNLRLLAGFSIPGFQHLSISTDENIYDVLDTYELGRRLKIAGGSWESTWDSISNELNTPDPVYRLKYTEGFDSERFHKQKLIDMQEYVVTQHINRQNNSPFFLLPY